jgi:hypothetical protein
LDFLIGISDITEQAQRFSFSSALRFWFRHSFWQRFLEIEARSKQSTIDQNFLAKKTFED